MIAKRNQDNTVRKCPTKYSMKWILVDKKGPSNANVSIYILKEKGSLNQNFNIFAGKDYAKTQNRNKKRETEINELQVKSKLSVQQNFGKFSINT